MITAKLVGDKVKSSSIDSFSLYEKSNFGEKSQNSIEYIPSEVLYLVSEEKMKVFSGFKAQTEEQLIKKFKKSDKKIETKSIVFKDLRKKGYIIKTALKFGVEFRVYDKGSKPGKEHARWLLQTAKVNENINWHDFAAKSRIANSTKKTLLVGLVDEEN